jgi:hypothetical protein
MTVVAKYVAAEDRGDTAQGGVWVEFRWHESWAAIKKVWEEILDSGVGEGYHVWWLSGWALDPGKVSGPVVPGTKSRRGKLVPMDRQQCIVVLLS